MADEGRYKLLRDLPDRAFAALMDDIAANGLRRPIAVDEDGNILDGFQRRRACDMLGRESESEVHEGLDEIGKYRFVVQANSHRMRGTVRIVVAAELARRGLSQRQVADILGVHQPQVSTWLKGVSGLPDTVRGRGKWPQDVSRRRRRPDTGRIEARWYTLIPSDIHGLAAKLEAASIDAIITESTGTLTADWVADEDGLPSSAAAALGKLAAKVLRPGRSLAIMVTRDEMAACIQELPNEHLKLQDVLAYELESASWSLGGKTADWRPVLWLTNGEPDGELHWPPDEDRYEGVPQDAGTVHQGDLIASFTRPGDVILDPLTNNLGVLLLAYPSERRVVAAAGDDIDGIALLVDDMIYHDRLSQAMEVVRGRSGENDPGRLMAWVAEDGHRLVQMIRDEFDLAGEEVVEVARGLLERLRAELKPRSVGPQANADGDDGTPDDTSAAP